MSKQIQSTKHKIQNTFKTFRISNLFWILDFGFGTARAWRGQAVLTAVIFLLFVSIATVFAFSTIALSEMRTARGEETSSRAYMLAEAGVEDVSYRIFTGKQYASPESLTLDGATTVTTVTTVGPTREVVSRGNVSSRVRAVKTVFIISTGVSFPYGAQVGDGGLTMEENSQVTGSVYSNGNITGASGATITGDAFIAIGAPAVVNQSWEVQNSDTSVGITVGSIITALDTAGNVGSYTSLVLGSDGLPRISYVDTTNGNLKFARCTNTDCSTKVVSVVDSGGGIDEVTSLALGQDGFPRISYYHDGNDDLKFARCTNEDCTAKVLTLVDTANNVGDFSSLKIGPDGFARIAYWYDTGSDVRFARCTNADCTARNITTVESVGQIGEYISLALGSDGFGRMSYYDATNKDLKFTRCLNADCTTSIITIIDSAGDVGQYTSLVLGSDGFGRVSYYDVTNDDLKFVRCTNTDCTTGNIAVVDSLGTVGRHTSIALGVDGFARMSYYDSSNGDLRFARCTNNDCTTREATTVDPASSVGLYTSLAVGADGFGRTSYYASTDGDLKFVRCTAASCPPSEQQVDVAQSFQPTTTDRITRIDLLLKKVGSPPNTMVRLIRDSGGRPSTSQTNVIATGAIVASSVTGSYLWVSVYLTSTPTLTANTPYWIVIDSSLNETNYFVWGNDSAAGYTRGAAKKSADWTQGNWTDVPGDLDFRVYMGGTDREIKAVAVDGNANGHVVDGVTVGGNANAFILKNSTVGGNVNAQSLVSCTIGGNASYNSTETCTIGGIQTTPTIPPSDPAYLSLPISTTTISAWKSDAESGGTCVPPQCLSNGDYDPSGCSVSLGPKKITGSLRLDASCSGGQLLTVTGTIWVAGNIEISNNARIKLNSSYGSLSGVMIADGTIHLSNNGVLSGSGSSGSYLMLLSTATGGGHHGSAIDLHNNADGAIFYASRGLVYLHNNVRVTELVGEALHLDNNAELIYEIGLSNIQFSSGPTGGYDIQEWKEVE